MAISGLELEMCGDLAIRIQRSGVHHPIWCVYPLLLWKRIGSDDLEKFPRLLFIPPSKSKANPGLTLRLIKASTNSTRYSQLFLQQPPLSSL